MVKKLKNNRLPLLLPFLLMMIIAPETYGASRPIPVKYKEYTQLAIEDILFNAPKTQELSSTIFLKGKVLRSPLLQNDEIIIYRMVITCCAADALPLGVLVKLPKKMDFHNEDWIGLEGVIQLLPFNENLKAIEPIANMIPPEKIYPYFTAAKAYKINTPPEEYLYY
jgi:uncharacterized membrane protein YcgQ (UPF0703/DUF1980 family)